MSEAAAPRIRPETLAIGIVAALGLMIGAYLMSQRQQPLFTSPSGFDGLHAWLVAQDVAVRKFTGGWPLDPEGIGLQIVPVYDSLPVLAREAPTTRRELLMQQDEYDLELSDLRDKAARVPTLLVLPKWRSGMRLTGLAHPVLLIEAERIEALLGGLTGSRARLGYGTRPFTDFAYRTASGDALTAQVYAVQTFASGACAVLIGTPDRALLADCPLARHDARVLVLADPDLLNNHGLRLGDNALIARDLLAGRAAGREVLIDYSRTNWLVDGDPGPARERTWSDLAGFLRPPFAQLWAGVALLAALFLWRASVRYGPVIGGARDDGGLQPIRVRSRLMRLTGQDGTMLAEYASARVAAVAARLVGPGHARQIGEEQAFLRYLHRHRPAQAHRFAAALERLRALPPRIAPAEAVRRIDDFEDALRQVTDEP